MTTWITTKNTKNTKKKAEKFGAVKWSPHEGEWPCHASVIFLPLIFLPYYHSLLFSCISWFSSVIPIYDRIP
jgi:hypothetical protein